MNTRFNWHRALILGVVLFATAIGIALLPVAVSAYREYKATKITPIVASTKEFQSVLRVILSEMKFEGEPPPPPELGEPPRLNERKPVVVINETVAFCDVHKAAEPGCESLGAESILDPSVDSEIPVIFRRELVAANSASVPFTCSESKLVRCASPEAVFTTLANGDSWRNFYSKFPNTAGYIHAGNVVLSSDGETALAYVAYGCGSMCGMGVLVQLKRSGASWAIVRQLRVWVV